MAKIVQKNLTTYILKFITELGWTKGVFTIFFFLAHFWIFKLYNARIKDRQTEINRIAKENREYRKTLLKMIDSKYETGENNN